LATLEQPAWDEITVAADIDGEEDTIVERLAAWIEELA
jgi:gluconate kinase